MEKDNAVFQATGEKLYELGMVPLALKMANPKDKTAKRPIINGWVGYHHESHPRPVGHEGDRPLNIDTLKSREWGWDDARGVGVAMGYQSGNLACIDLETDDAAKLFTDDKKSILGKSLLEKLTKFPWAKTVKGMHIIVRLGFRCPPKMAFNRGGKTVVELLCQGQQIAVPGTFDAPGDGIRWWVNPPAKPVSEWPTLTPAEWDSIVMACADLGDPAGDNPHEVVDPSVSERSSDDGYTRANCDHGFQQKALDLLLSRGGYRFARKRQDGGIYMVRGEGTAHTATWNCFRNSRHGFPYFKNFDTDHETRVQAPTDIVRDLECGNDDQRFRDLLKDLGFWRGPTTPKPAVDARHVIGETDETHEPEAKVPMEPFPAAEIFPAGIAEFCFAAAERLMVDPAAVGCPMMGAVAGAIGAQRTLVINPAWVEPPTLWVGLLMDSGSNKSAAVELATRPLATKDMQLACLNDEAMRNYHRLLHQWKEAPKNQKGEPPEKPIELRAVVANSTIEKVADLLGQNPRGLMMVQDELSSWFQRMRQGNTDTSGEWLGMHSGNRVTIDRIMRGTTHLERPLLSIVGGIQPGVIGKLLNGQAWASGLAPRFLLCNPPSSKRVYLDDTGVINGQGAYFEAMKAILDGLRPLPAESTADMPLDLKLIHHPVAMDPEAKAMWIQDHDARSERVFLASGGRKSQLAKLVSTSARWALCHHVLLSVLDGQERPFITAESVAAGIRAAAWFERESARCLGAMVVAASIADDEPILHMALSAGQDGIGTRNLMRRWRKQYPDSMEALAKLQGLVEDGLLVHRTIQKGPKNKPVDRWYHPSA